MPYKHLKTDLKHVKNAQKQAQNVKTRGKNDTKWPKNVIKRQMTRQKGLEKAINAL